MTRAPSKSKGTTHSTSLAIPSKPTTPSPGPSNLSVEKWKLQVIERYRLDVSVVKPPVSRYATSRQWPYDGVKTDCRYCGIIFELNGSQRIKVRKNQANGGFFCSLAHQNQWHRKTFNAEIARRGAAKMGATHRANAVARGATGYVKVNSRHHHRTVAEEKLGRALLPGEIVHHIDRNRRNNHPDNLEVMTQSEHASLHSKEYWAKKKSNV